jgi:hypothetical protein
MNACFPHFDYLACLELFRDNRLALALAALCAVALAFLFKRRIKQFDEWYKAGLFAVTTVITVAGLALYVGNLIPPGGSPARHVPPPVVDVQQATPRNDGGATTAGADTLPACPAATAAHPAGSAFRFATSCYKEAGCRGTGEICARYGLRVEDGRPCSASTSPVVTTEDRYMLAELAAGRGCTVDAFGWLAGEASAPAMRDRAVILAKTYCDDPLAPHENPVLHELGGELGVAIACLSEGERK